MSLTNEQIVEAIGNKSVLEIVELIKTMEEKFGVTAAQPVAMMAAAAAPAEAAAEKTEFKVRMTNFGSNKVGVIKVIREITNLGLKEAKDLVEAVPALVKEGIKKDEADKIKAKLEEAGATVEVV